jgi:molybdopterin synthase catalytic subunit
MGAWLLGASSVGALTTSGATSVASAPGAGTTVLPVDGSPRAPVNRRDAAPPGADDWVGVCEATLPVSEASEWAVRPHCGAVVTFTGRTRDNSSSSGPGGVPDRTGVSVLEYEVYDEQVVPRLEAVVAELRRRWPVVGRVALLHRVGEVRVGQPSVVVAVSAPHRDEAFAAARFGIDTLKATVPIWKREVWSGGAAWGLDAHPIDDL